MFVCVCVCAFVCARACVFGHLAERRKLEARDHLVCTAVDRRLRTLIGPRRVLGGAAHGAAPRGREVVGRAHVLVSIVGEGGPGLAITRRVSRVTEGGHEARREEESGLHRAL